MKKILSAVAAFGLVVGVASTAAAVDVSLTGRYVVEGYYLSDAQGGGLVLNNAAGDVGSDAYFVHTLKIAPVMKVNDKIKLVTDVWLADNSFWGNQEDTAGAAEGRAMTSSEKDVEVWQAYMDYASPVGQLRVGRVLVGPFGTSFLDTIGHANRIMWWPSMLKSGPWTTILKYQKTTEHDGAINLASAAATDQDRDYYEIHLSHKGAKGLGNARISLDNNQTGLNTGLPANAGNVDSKIWRGTLSGAYDLGAFYVNSEVDYAYGKNERVGQPDVDIRRLGAFLQLGTKMGALDVSGMYVYASGDDNAATDNKLEALGTLGNEFQPYYILTGPHAGIFNTKIYSGAAINGQARTAGLHSFGLHANYAMSERLMLHGAVAYHMADKELATFDDEYGIEYNVGAAYKLLDNLTYEAHFGYLDTGDFFRGAAGTAASEESVFLVSNHLTMTF
jgi:hypothetical protein